ncbi:endo-alpha-N-acetylgalactosaminidase family protein [Cohnella silvisoli]|uniref:Endo-alpha-N-acetylgalactosaminidase family protein n=1 Tax=Cohnella silvisoli TaxID=2873699 RepID=A0ABV1KL79_9BACL|nr:endo-alpha-N-acetylgalactosaminidase family protein [Cohnella silvisoli]MCD9020774.1 hypothetical protein [Cohnella silvisoli]
MMKQTKMQWFMCVAAFSLLAFFSLLFVEKAEAATQTLSNNFLSVQVDDAFPRVIQYTDLATNAVIYGQEDSLSKIKINGTLYTPSVTSIKSSDTITYNIDISSISVSLIVEFKLVDNVLEMNVTQINDSGSTKVYRLEFPDQNLVSVRSTQSGAAMAYNQNFIDNDTFSTVLNKSIDASPQRVGHSIIYTDALAAAIETGMTTQSSYVQTVDKGVYKRTGLWAYESFYRGPDDKVTELPWVKIKIVADENGDGSVDWQDGAIAYRSIMDPLPGPINLAQKTIFSNLFTDYWGKYPWTWESALDYLKRQALATDKFPQILLAKTSHQGIDGWPSYGEASDVLGGNSQFNWLVDEAANWNIYVGTHTNSREAYPESSFWADTPLSSTVKGQPWAMIDREAQLNDQDQYWGSGLLGLRYDAHKAAFPNMKFQYLDIELGNGLNARWQAYQQIKKFKQNGWQLFTEYSIGYPQVFDPSISYLGTKYLSWAHTSLNSGSSNIRRFIMNHVTIVGAGNTTYQNVLGKGYADTYGYLGYVGPVPGTINSAVQEFWKHTLADTYLKNFEILNIYNDSSNNNNLTALFTKGVKSVYDGNVRKIYKNNILQAALNNTSQDLFLPWEVETEEKIYTFSSGGGIKEWTLPSSWSGLKTLKLYKLNQTTGREFAADISVSNGKVSIAYEAEQGYVLLKEAAPQTSVIWGDGSKIKDFEFNSTSFAYWNRSDAQAVTIAAGTEGNYMLQISGSGDHMASQTISGLQPGKSYAITAAVNIIGDKTALLGVKEYGRQEVVDSIDHNVTFNADRLDSWPRLKVYFTMPLGHTSATVYLKGTGAAGNGDIVQFDDIRLLEESNPIGGKHSYFEGFEDTHWAGPFVAHRTDTVATISKANPPYTIDTIAGSGNKSFKIMHWNHNYNPIYDTIVKTLPNQLKLKPHTTYRLSFKFKPMYGPASGWQYRIRSNKGNATLFSQNLSGSQDQVTLESKRFTTSSFDDYSLEFVNQSSSNADIVIDDLTVDTIEDDTDPAWGYSSKWIVVSSPDRFNSSAHAVNDNTGGQTAKLTFCGSNIKLYMRKSYDAQIVNMQVDNGAVEVVDLYSSSLDNQVMVWQKSGLADTLHTLTITTTGTKNASSTGYWAELDFAEVPESSDHLVDDNASEWTYDNMWSSGTAADRHNGSYHYINTTVMHTAVFNFTGTGAKLFTRIGPDQQIIKVQVDSEQAEAIDLYDISHRNKVLVWQKTGLAPGNHTITVITTGTKNTNSTNYWAEVDAVQILTDYKIKLDDSSTNWTFTSGWLSGSAGNRYNGTYHYVNTGGKTATVQFSGTDVLLATRIGIDQQIIKIRVDNQADETVDLFSPTFTNKAIVWQKSGLAPGSHTLTITTTGTKNSSSTGYWAEMDYIEISSP